MLDIGWSELVVVAAITLVVVGPKEIPRVLRTVRGLIAKIRGLTSEFQNTMEQAARDADIADLKKELKAEKNQYDQTKDKLFQQILYDDSVQTTKKDIEEIVQSSADDMKAATRTNLQTTRPRAKVNNDIAETNQIQTIPQAEKMSDNSAKAATPASSGSASAS